MKQVILFLAACLMIACNSELEIKKIVTIAVRHANEIESNNWSVGAKTMERKMTLYRNWKQYLGPLGCKTARITSNGIKQSLLKANIAGHGLILLCMI